VRISGNLSSGIENCRACANPAALRARPAAAAAQVRR